MTNEAKALEPIAVGPPEDTAISALLDEMRAAWDAQGVDTTISPREFTRLRKAPGQPSAIPPRSSWADTGRFLAAVWNPLRRGLGQPINVVNGYRPADYNAAVGGAPKSLHVRGLALDLKPTEPGAADRLALGAAALYLTRGQAIRMGLGIYGLSSPSIHVDAFGRGAPQAGWAGAEATTEWLERARTGVA